MGSRQQLDASTQRMLGLSDEKLGETLRNDLLKMIRDSSKETTEREILNELLVEQMADEFGEHFISDAISHTESTLYWLAGAFALKRQFDRAGRAYRAYYTKVYPTLGDRRRVEIQNRRLAKLNAEKIANSRKRKALWLEVGREIRSNEQGWPMSNKALARRIAEKTGDSQSTIQRALTGLGLGVKKWRDEIRARNAVNRNVAKSRTTKHSRNKRVATR